MARITAPLLGLALAFGGMVHAGEPPVLLAMPAPVSGGAAARALTPEQQAVLDAVTDDPRVLELRLAWTPEDALSAVTEARAMALDVPGGRVSFTGVGVRHNAEAMVSLSAGDPAQEDGPSASLVVQGADVLGAITHRGETRPRAPGTVRCSGLTWPLSDRRQARPAVRAVEASLRRPTKGRVRGPGGIDGPGRGAGTSTPGRLDGGSGVRLSGSTRDRTDTGRARAVARSPEPRHRPGGIDAAGEPDGSIEPIAPVGWAAVAVSSTSDCPT